MMRASLLWVLGAVVIMESATAGLYEEARGPLVEVVHAAAPKAQIVIPAQPSLLEEFAAAELQRYLAKISGAKLPVLKEGEVGTRPFSFYLGGTQKARAAGVAPDERRMGRDGFALRSAPGGLIVLGNNELGTVFGVYELLERCFDVRWFMPGELGEQVPRRDSLRLGQMNLVFNPSFRVRWVCEGEWSLHQRMNVAVKVGERIVGINWKWHFHTFRTLIPPEKYYAEHPDYFALVKGKRTVTESKTHENQLCTANPEVVREVAKKLIATLDAEPGVEIIALSPNDGGGFCECEQCQALDEPGRDWFARYSRRLATFNSEVAKLVSKRYPRVLIKTGAYAMYARPPLDKDYRPALNQIVQLCHLYFCHNHTIGRAACEAGRTYTPKAEFQPNQEFRKVLDQWLELSPHVFVYEYYTVGGISRAGLPWPLVHTIGKDIPYYHKRGVEGFYTQASEGRFYQLGLNYYLAAKLCWNAELNVDALLADYFEKFYGPAVAPMREYFMGMDRSLEQWNGCVSYGLQGVTGLKVIGPKIFTPEVMAQMGSHLEQAEQLAKGDETLAKRVGLARRMYDETRQSLATMGGK
jgi:hypothetical protein